MAKEKATAFFVGDALQIAEAIETRDNSRLSELIGSDSNLDGLHLKQMTYMHFAMYQGNEEAIRILVEHNASPHIELEGLGSVMACAISASDMKYLKALLDAGVDPNCKDKWGMPMFFEAAVKEDLSALKLLIEFGADLDLPSQAGTTAILNAFLSSAYDQVEFLIKMDVDLQAATNQGLTLAYAVQVEIEDQKIDPSTPAYQKLVEIQDLMKKRGVRFPASPPKATEFWFLEVAKLLHAYWTGKDIQLGCLFFDKSFVIRFCFCCNILPSTS